MWVGNYGGCCDLRVECLSCVEFINTSADKRVVIAGVMACPSKFACVGMSLSPNVNKVEA